MDLTELIVDESAAVARQAADVRTVVVHHLAHRPRGEVVAEYAKMMTGARRQEVHGIAAVDRRQVGALLVRDLDGVEPRKPGDPQGAGAAAAVIAPGHVV